MSTAPLWQRPSRVSGSPRLLAARGQALMGRAGRHFARILRLILQSLCRAWVLSRKPTGEKHAAVRGGGLGAAMSAVMGRALAGKADRMLSVEERVTVPPKLFMLRYAREEDRELFASAAEVRRPATRDQLSPAVISTQLKILLLEMVDGWHLWAASLLKSF